MANNYCDLTGVLVLDSVTPVITALFGEFKLDATYPGNGKAYIAKISEDNNPQWGDVHEKLATLCAEAGLSLLDESDDTIGSYAAVLASHLNKHSDQAAAFFAKLDANSCPEDESAELDVLFDLARSLDDGHGLKSMKIESGYHCDKPHLFEFGGSGEYYGRHFCMFSASATAVILGKEIDAALEANSLDEAAKTLVQAIDILLDGVDNPETRSTLRGKLAASLACA